MKVQYIIAILVLVIILAVASYVYVQNQQFLGGDRDAHGCIGSAGYSWCEAKSKCIRIWEENCTETVDQACTNSGGTVTTALCCKSSNDFPNTCLIGACGCSPENSRTVKMCDCGEGKCFNGNTCIVENFAVTTATTTT